MEYKINYAPRVCEDLDAIHSYIEERSSTEKADHWCLKITDQINNLQRFPSRCPIAPENAFVDEEIRHTFVGEYRIIFVVDSSSVQILHIRHGKRLPATPQEIA